MPDFSERLLRHIWERRLFRTEGLRTADGRAVAILHPGRFNEDAGPDYLDARIRIGTITYRGDVELHLSATSWETHGHTGDPHYNRVILHVVLEDDGLRAPAATASRRLLPLLVLHPFLDASFAPPLLGPGSGNRRAASPLPCAEGGGPCSVAGARLRLKALAGERIELKVRRFDERLRELVEERRSVLREPYPRYYGDPSEIPPPARGYSRRDVADRAVWEQLLFEGIMEGMGYAKNTGPFLALARSVPLALLRRVGLENTEAVTALLFGAGGLLPSSRRVVDPAARKLLQSLRRAWHGLRPLVKGPLVHEGDWKFFRMRPAGFPTARLAAVCAVLPVIFGGEGFRGIVRTAKDESLDAAVTARRLADFFTAEPDPFWRTHYRFAAGVRRAGAGIGRARIHEIMVNSLLPLLLLYARVFHEPDFRSRVLDILHAVPEGHAIPETRAVRRAFGPTVFRAGGAFLAQGAIHLVRLYCAPRRCGECDMGRVQLA